MPAFLKWATTDFETASALDVRKVGAWVYSEHPTTEILCVCWSIEGKDAGEWLPGQAAGELGRAVKDDSVTFLSFGDFERAIWANIMVKQFGFEPLPDYRWHDIQASAAMKQMPKDLDTLARVLKLPVQKDMDASKFTIGLSKPRKDGTYDRSPEALKIAVDYCHQDVATETMAHERLGWLPPVERTSWLLNQRINRRGIGIDLEYVSACKEVARQSIEPLIEEFKSITGLTPTQNAKIVKWCNEQGAPDDFNLQKQTLIEALGTDIDAGEDDAPDSITVKWPNMPDNVRRALTIRQLAGSSSLGKLDAMERATCEDGRARGLLQWHGTGPGRSTGRLLQPHNFPKPTVKIGGKMAPVETVVAAIMTRDAQFVEEIVGPAIPTVVGGLRHAMKAMKGRVFMSGDYSGIQARLVLAVAGQHDKTALMASGADVYCDMAEKIYHRPIDKDKDPKERGIGKNSVLGLGFQMGGKTFRVKYAREHPLSFCNEVVQVYRKEWAPLVPKLWYGLEDAAKETVFTGRPHEAFGCVYQIEGEWLTCTVPSGSKIWYYAPYKTKKVAPWDNDLILDSFGYYALDNHFWTRCDAFGGQLAENVIMRMEADIMRSAQVKCENNGLPIVLEVHDEILVEPLAKDADQKAFEQIMRDVDPWVKNIKVPIAVEGWPNGPEERYRK